VTVVIGVDGAGRTHRLTGIAAAAGVPVVRIATAGGTPPDLPARLAAARADGALVVVDDAHRLDAASLSALAAAVHDGLSIALGRRPTITSPALAALDEAAAAGGVEHLGPLSTADLTALVASVTGRTPSDEEVAAVAAASGGWAAVAAAVAAAPAGARSPVLAARVHRRLALLDAGVAALARVLAARGYAPQVRELGELREVGAGRRRSVQLCQHHCPVAHVAAEFPELCEAETRAIARLLGTHVQRLSTIARGGAACTTHVPLEVPEPLGSDRSAARGSAAPTTASARPGGEDRKAVPHDDRS
jgi:predicted ArsR family transcriptional regulator